MSGGVVVVHVLADSDLMVLIRETMGVVDTRALSRTCRAIHEVLHAQLAEWRMQWDVAKESDYGRAHGLARALACAGHLKLLRWRLRWRIEKRRLQWDPLITADAAAGGHLAVLKYLHAAGGYLSRRTCARAAMNGHLEVLKWLRANGCPWDGEVCN